VTRTVRRATSPGRAVPRIFTVRSAVSFRPGIGGIAGSLCATTPASCAAASTSRTQKRFVATHEVFTFAAAARFKPRQPIEETELRAVRQAIERSLQVVRFYFHLNRRCRLIARAVG